MKYHAFIAEITVQFHGSSAAGSLSVMALIYDVAVVIFLILQCWNWLDDIFLSALVKSFFLTLLYRWARPTSSRPRSRRSK